MSKDMLGRRYSSYEAQPESHKTTGKAFIPCEDDVMDVLEQLIAKIGSYDLKYKRTMVKATKHIAKRVLQESNRLSRPIEQIIELFAEMLESQNFAMRAAKEGCVMVRHMIKDEQMTLIIHKVSGQVRTMYFWTDYEPQDSDWNPKHFKKWS